MSVASRVVVAAAGAVALANSVSAFAVPDTRPYIGLSGSVIFEDSARQSDTGYGGKITIGQRFTDLLGFEIGGFSHQYRGGPAADWDEYGVLADVNVFLTRGESFAPYVFTGGGVMRSKASSALLTLDQRRAFGHVGAGFKVFPQSSLVGFTADYRFRFFDTSIAGVEVLNDHIVSLGLLVPLGSREMPVEPKAIVDSDGDGVPDHLDQCPNTPAGVRVDSRGCPLDSDGDGVPDYLDKCPDTKPGVRVDEHGCPVDVLGPNRVFENVYFAFDRSDLTDQAKAVLDAAANVINQLVNEHPRLTVQLDGHTDSIGSPGYNVGLSERRANSVKQYLVRKGVDARRIQTQAFGLTKPVASNDTEEGRALNRRVEIRTRSE